MKNIDIQLNKLEREGDFELINLAKKTLISMKKSGFDPVDQLVRVALCLDFSGSMRKMLSDGTVTKIVKKCLAQSIILDDNGEIEVFGFGTDAKYLCSVNVANYNKFCEQLQVEKPNFGQTNYNRALEEIIKFYDATGYDLPVLVIFVTDGNTANKRLTTQIIKDSSTKPIFWQFVGIGKDNYDPTLDMTILDKLKKNTEFKYLVKLDELSGRKIDNAGFFAVHDPNLVSDEKIYDSINHEFPEWLEAAKKINLY